ncbi:hypothetical protein B0H10DRAFT_1951841 [Mycena sp. CBHHK59/15]|nr:hypothetical protein B0H10DRAFT_1951841 [Mycena sp. CBHHK59/15]
MAWVHWMQRVRRNLAGFCHPGPNHHFYLHRASPLLPVVYAMRSRAVRVACAGRFSVWPLPHSTRQVELHGGPITVPLRSTPRRILAVLPPSSPSPRKAAMPLTDGVFEVARRGHSDFLLYCHIPIDARRPPPPPPPSAFPPTIGRSRNAQIAGCPRTPLHRFRDDTGEPRLAAHAPVIPPIEVLPRVTPTLDPRPNATRGKSTCTRVDSPYLLARCFDEARPSHRSHLRALATPSWDSYGASPLDCPIAIHAVSSDPSTPPYTFSPTAARSRGAEIASWSQKRLRRFRADTRAPRLAAYAPRHPSHRCFARVCVQLNRTRRRHALTLVDPARIFPGLDARLACTQPHHANFQNLFAPSTSSHSMSTLPAAGSCERARPAYRPSAQLPALAPPSTSLTRRTARGQTQARVRRGTTSTPPRSDICVAGDADVAHWKYELRRAVVVGSGKKEWGGLNMPAVADARSRPPLPCTFSPLLAVHDRSCISYLLASSSELTLAFLYITKQKSQRMVLDEGHTCIEERQRLLRGVSGWLRRRCAHRVRYRAAAEGRRGQRAVQMVAVHVVHDTPPIQGGAIGATEGVQAQEVGAEKGAFPPKRKSDGCAPTKRRKYKERDSRESSQGRRTEYIQEGWEWDSATESHSHHQCPSPIDDGLKDGTRARAWDSANAATSEEINQISGIRR